MLVVVENRREGLVLVEPKHSEVFRYRMHAGALDRELADGLPPERSRARAVWASLLVRPQERRSAARALARLMRTADEPVVSRGPRLTVGQRLRIHGAAESLSRLVARLRAPRPVSAAGMAKVRLLLSDAGAPLHGDATADDLDRAVTDALVELDAWFDWPATGQGSS